MFLILFNFSFITFAQDNSIQMKPVINLKIAKIMADACESHQKKTGYRPVNIAIVDAGGDLVLFRRQNNSFLLSIDIAIAKANLCRHSSAYQNNSRYCLWKRWQTWKSAWISTFKNIVAFPGGLPIKTKMVYF